MQPAQRGRQAKSLPGLKAALTILLYALISLNLLRANRQFGAVDRSSITNLMIFSVRPSILRSLCASGINHII